MGKTFIADRALEETHKCPYEAEIVNVFPSLPLLNYREFGYSSFAAKAASIPLTPSSFSSPQGGGGGDGGWFEAVWQKVIYNCRNQQKPLTFCGVQQKRFLLVIQTPLVPLGSE